MIQEQLFVSELFKDIQDAILLILHYKTTSLFRATSSSIITILDVRSIFILSSTLDKNLELKIRARDRQYSSCLLILWTKVTKIQKWLTWMYHIMHNTCTISRRSILGRHQSCYWAKIDILSDSIQCNYPARNTSSLLYSKSCEIEDWRSLIWEIIHVSSTTTKDLLETRMEERIRFRSRSTCRSWAAI